MFTVRLRLKTTVHDRQVIEKRFRAIHHIHNVLVKRAKSLLQVLKDNAEYQALRAAYGKLLEKSTLSEEENIRKKELASRMNEIRKEIGLSEYGLQSYIKVCVLKFQKCIGSNEAQKEATRVWRGVEKVLFFDGKDIHYKKESEIYSICDKTNTTGIMFKKDIFSIKWFGLEIPCAYPKKEKDIAYVEAALENKISYCEVTRIMFPNGWHYYVTLYLKGDAPKTGHKVAEPGNVTGIDMGVSTVAAASDNKVILEELAPKSKEFNKKINQILRYMDRSRRAMNPKKYKSDGTIDRSNKDKWAYSNSYMKAWRKLRSLYRQKAAYIKTSHGELANRMLEDSVDFLVEDMNFKGLQHRAKKTERSDKVSIVKNKDGSEKEVHKFKKKKRFGKSINDRAPAEFLSILEQKAVRNGGNMKKVNTREFKASQYDHSTGECKKCLLSERFKTIDGRTVQRDLYSAFLIKNSNKSLKNPDQKKCKEGFDNFCKLSDNLIMEMKEKGISMKQCFGF